jgi:hypothetical protein
MSDSNGQITIRIGGELERSIEVSFGTIENRANTVGKNVAKALGGGTGSANSGLRAAAREADRASKEIEQSFARQVKAAERASKDEYQAFQKAARERAKLEAGVERERDRFFRQQTRNAEREAERQEKIAERQAARAAAATQRFASRTSQRSVRFLFPNPIGAFGMASRIGGDILRGAGVDFSMAGMAQRAVQTQALATQLSNQGFMPHEKGANSQRVAAAQLESEARKTAQAQGFTTEQTLRSQTKFVDLTGNLDDARAALPAIMKLSGATGTDPEKMAEAWANVSRHMGNIPDKAAKVEGLMRLIAGQGRVGSIEIKDEAKDLGKIAAMADKFGGDRATSIGKLATLAQLAKAEGGAASSAQAATSVVSFVNTLQTPARVKAMMKAGMKEEDLFNMTGTGKNRVRSSLKDPFEIIKKGLEVTGGDLINFGNLFKSVMSQRATNALVAAYNSGGGRNTKAVDAKLNEFGAEAALSDKDVDAAQNERLKTAAAQATIFQEKLDEVGKNVEAELLPALQQLSPYVLQAATAFGNIVTWATNNPGEAIVLAITGAIARAGLESAFRAGVEKAITSSPISVGSASATIGTATLAAASLAVAWNQADELGKTVGANSRATDVLMPGAKKGEFSWGQAAQDAAKFLSGGGVGYLAGKGGEIAGEYVQRAGSMKTSHALTPEEYDTQHPREALPFRADRFDPAQRSAELQRPAVDPKEVGREVAAALRSGLNVHVTNMPPSVPGVPDTGRSPAPGAGRR